MASEKNITGFMGILSASYPNYNLSRETIIIYQRTLSDIDDEVLENAVLHLITTSKFFPTVAEIRDAAFSIIANKSSLPSSYEAWQEAISHCHRGEYRNYSHPLIEKAAMIIGVEYWRNMNVDDEMPTRAHFFKIYESLLSRAESDMKMLPQVKEFSNRYQAQIADGIKKLADKLSQEAK